MTSLMSYNTTSTVPKLFIKCMSSNVCACTHHTIFFVIYFASSSPTLAPMCNVRLLFRVSHRVGFPRPKLDIPWETNKSLHFSMRVR